jgi:hypothetical protein
VAISGALLDVNLALIMLARAFDNFFSIRFESFIFHHGVFPFYFRIDTFISFHMLSQICPRISSITIWALNFASSTAVFTSSASIVISGAIALVFLEVLDRFTFITVDASLSSHDCSVHLLITHRYCLSILRSDKLFFQFKKYSMSKYYKMSVAKYLDHLEKDAELIKEYVTRIRNGLSVVNPNEDVRKDIEDTLFDLYRITHFIEHTSCRMTNEAHKIIDNDENSTDSEK